MRTIILTGIALVCCASAVAATGAVTPPAASVKASAAVLTATDLPGSSVASQKAVGSSFAPLRNPLSSYTRTFESVKFAGKQLVVLTSSVDVASSVAKAHAAIAVFADPEARAAILDGLKSGGTGKLLRYRKIATGDDTIDISLALVEQHQALAVGVLFIQVGPVLETLVYVAQSSGLSPGATVNLAKLAVARIKSASTGPPVNSVLPTVTGAPTLGQIITAQPGTWTGTAPAYTYQWFRCNSAGAACVTITGSTQATYTISTVDQGQTLAVSVSDSNSAGAKTVMSLPTAIVS